MSKNEFNDGGPAFPVGSGDMRDPIGMTVRQWYKGQAITGWAFAMVSRPGYSDNAAANEAVRLACLTADHMIAEDVREGE